MVEGVRAHSPRAEGLRLDAIEASADGMNQPESVGCCSHCPGQARSDEDIGVPERGQHGGIIPGSVPGDDRSRSNPPFKGRAVDGEAGVGDDDFHSVVSCGSSLNMPFVGWLCGTDTGSCRVQA